MLIHRNPIFLLVYWILLEFTYLTIVATTCTGNDIDGLRGTVIFPGVLLWLIIVAHIWTLARHPRQRSARPERVTSVLLIAVPTIWILYLCTRQLWTAGLLTYVAWRGYHFCDYIEQAAWYWPSIDWELQRSLSNPYTEIDALVWLSVVHIVVTAVLIMTLTIWSARQLWPRKAPA